MKNIYIYTCLFLSVLCSCTKQLNEEPHSILTPAFFTTAQGLQKGLDAAYARTRNLWGAQNLFTMTVIGTDEFYTGKDGNNGINKYNSNYTTLDGTVSAIWKECYLNINTCNGIIDYAESSSDLTDKLKSSMVAEAKFLRANFYFILVQFWGDVTLNEHFQDVPTTSAVRTPMSEVYDFIVKDLQDVIASSNIGISPKSNGVLPGKANKAAAMHVLSKVYLTRAGSSAKKADDYKNAHTTALELINTVAPANGLSLLPDFGTVFAEGNEGSSEVLWTVQHTSNLAYNGPNNSGGADNVLNHMWVPQYELQPGMKRDVIYGRPYIRCVPTKWVTDTLYNDKVNDTRYHKTFQTVWYSNNEASIPKWTSPLPVGAPANAVVGQPKFTLGDTAIYMPDVKSLSSEKIKASRYLLMPSDNYTISLSPYMKKYNDTKRADLNYPSIRPVIVYRLADTYLIAAEALFMDNRAVDAVPYINAIRRRAAYPNVNPSVLDIAATDLSVDYILDERSRELCGELTRWLDLVRTGKLLERVKKHNGEAGANIKPYHVLRPIPQSQIDGTTTGEKYPQNLGWF